MRFVNVLMLFVLAPFLGLAFSIYGFASDTNNMLLPLEKTGQAVESIAAGFETALEKIGLIAETAQEQESRFREQQSTLGQLSEQVSTQRELSDNIYEERILAMLGPPVKIYKSSRVEVKVFKLDEMGYRGYIAKVKLYDPSAFKVVLAKDTPGEKETTLEAVQRTGAILGINGGGFYTEMRDGKPYAVPMGNVMIDGKLLGPFNPYPENLFFAGINRQGKFIGGIFYELNGLMALDPWQGVSFVPVLIKGGLARPVDQEWKETKHPRTIIGEYANGDIIFIVVDGRQSDWSSGVTLERLLDKLVELGVKEGYNLDGGGSSTFVYDGKILNRPSDGKPRPVVTNIVIMP
ncbi:MAG: phosphodiester glycosidase family protein [Peptococcaceae bacterium]|jgi:exopolysaccharide biosynthesis protein|nr:phosphodiester glycosidase family protein [Peptococcaceae bacterium]MDH7525699.1 phosphodiester glycosidase family protein [Peptococcaceae bacterium]